MRPNDTSAPRLLLFLALLRCLGTARASFIRNRYKTDHAYFAARDTSVGFTPYWVLGSRSVLFRLRIQWLLRPRAVRQIFLPKTRASLPTSERQLSRHSVKLLSDRLYQRLD